MWDRCTNPAYHSYHRYGGRGIGVDLRWRDYQTYKADMAETYKPGYTLDRLDNDGDYCKANCEWKPKGKNLKPERFDIKVIVELRAKNLTQKQIAKMLGTDQPHISRILRRHRGTAKD